MNYVYVNNEALNYYKPRPATHADDDVPVKAVTGMKHPPGKIVPEGQENNWPTDTQRAAYPPWNGTISVNVGAGIIFKVSLTCYILDGFGCHSRGIANISASPLSGHHPDMCDLVAAKYGFAVKEIDKTWDSNASLYNIYYSLKKIPGIINFRNDVNEKLYQHCLNALIGQKVMIIASDRISRSTDEQGQIETVTTGGFMRYLSSQGWCVTGSPIAANQNYFKQNLTLVQGYIALAPIPDGHPRIAYDTAFVTNRNEKYTLKVMNDYFDKQPNAPEYHIDFKKKLGKIVDYFGNYFQKVPKDDELLKKVLV